MNIIFTDIALSEQEKEEMKSVSAQAFVHAFKERLMKTDDPARFKTEALYAAVILEHKLKENEGKN